VRDDEAQQQQDEHRFMSEMEGRRDITGCTICGRYQVGSTYTAAAFRFQYPNNSADILNQELPTNPIGEGTIEDTDSIHVCDNCAQDGW